MSETTVVIVSDLVTVLFTIMIVTFAVGRTFGEVRHDITELKKDVAEIKGMFVMRLRRSNSAGDD